MEQRAASGLESPFVDGLADVAVERRAPRGLSAARGFATRESPFADEYHVRSGDDATGPLHGDPADDVAREMFADLADDELDDAIHELVDEATDLRLQESDGETYEAADEARLEGMLRAHFEPLANDAEAMIDRASELADAPDEELEAALDDLELPVTPSPAFEQFFGALKRKLKKLAGHAIGLAKRGLVAVAGPVIRKALATLKTIVRPLVEKVIKLAFDKIPARYRPVLRVLAQKLGLETIVDRAVSMGSGAASAVAGALAPAAAAPAAPRPSEEPATPSGDGVQEEMNLALVDSLLGGESPDREDETARAGGDDEARDPLRDVDAARERFVRELESLGEGEDAAPAIERFLPAVMMALRLGIRLIGRPKVVGFLGEWIGKLIAPLTGKEIAPQLGQIIADVGLKTILHAEAEEANPTRLAAEAIASTVEETMHRVAALPDEVLSEPLLFEAAVHEAFDAAAAANLPSQVLRADVRETELPSAWVRLPLRGPRLYKKLGRPFDVTIAPPAAAAIASFDGAPLTAFFRDRLRLAAAEPVRARVHVFEAIPRTRLARIAHHERIRGLGSSQRWAWSQLHPLTTDAAGLLLGAPRLGRDLEDGADPTAPRVGERYYYLEIDEAPGRPLGHASHVRLRLNLAKGRLRVCVYLSEVVAQTIASALRRKAPTAAIVGELRTVFAGTVARLLDGRARRAFRIVGARPSGAARTPAAHLARRALRRHVAARAFAWSWVAIAKHVAADPQAFLRAADRPEDGVHIEIAYDLPHAGDLARAYAGDASAPTTLAAAPPPPAAIHIFAGPRHG